MTKAELLTTIINSLEADLALFFAAAKAAHEAATHEECAPDNKYDTTALEASYLAQGQANRAQEIRVALEGYRNLVLQDFDDESPIRLTALVNLEDEEGNQRRLFLGPYAGGMKIPAADGEIVVITPGSPLGRSLLGKQVGDELQAEEHALTAAFTVVQVV
ncbi:GreA/GreB family elongation factor [Trichlorobacter thiogenes]|uniref:GreA/GreB family elongation factor n=1 Tax=Trichlorobacter thiogenes TaxID=115783 RepID=A0A1T4P0G0_9BACT|nr:transcription elongation factor GreAB [Trichlorobacter thiogenes]SJZ84862.1 GreA/GreB family elongation factor [Trichlorobacter thiogenes]